MTLLMMVDFTKEKVYNTFSFEGINWGPEVTSGKVAVIQSRVPHLLQGHSQVIKISCVINRGHEMVTRERDVADLITF